MQSPWSSGSPLWCPGDRARYLLSGIKFANGTWKITKQALSFRLESDARRLVDRAVLATLTSHLRCDD